MTNIINQTEQRQVMLGRLAAGLVRNNIYPTLAEAYKAAKAILDSAETITSITKLNAVTAQIRRAVTEIDTEGWAVVTKELEEIAIYDAAYYAGLVGTAASVKLSTPPDEKIIGYINKSIMTWKSKTGKVTDSGLWHQYTKAYTGAWVDRIDSIVRNGYSQGETVKQIADQIKLLANGEFLDKATNLARTGVQHYAVQGRQAMFADNTDQLAREYPIVTFDNRISSTCKGIGFTYKDGWPIGQSPVGYPPYHPQCRTAVIALPEGVKPEGTRAAVGGKKGEEAAEAAERKEERTGKKPIYKGKKDLTMFKPGQIPVSTPIDEFFARQPRWWLESNLGKEQADMFISGRLSFSDFYTAAGRPLTLTQLRALDGG